MQTRPALSALVFALVGCIGDNDAPLSGGGEGGGTSVDDPMDEADESGDDSSSGDDGPSYPPDGNASGGEGGDDDDGESGGDHTDPCGDGVRASFEQCDDGNGISGDGCDSDCFVTVGVFAFDLGRAHTCAVDYLGDVRCWGDNKYGQLGYASLGIDNVGANVTPKAFARTVSIGVRVVEIDLGMDHTCARSSLGEVFCWGRNDNGQLGYGHTDDLGDEPGEAPSDSGPLSLGAPAVSIGAGRAHTCALLETGLLKCWGDGRRGQLGLGDGFDGRVGAGTPPYAVAGVAPPIDMVDVITNAVNVGLGDFGCVADADGAVHCWGANESGQLGIGAAVDVGIIIEPMKHPAMIDDGALRIAAGEAHVCVLTDAFEVQCFGRNDHGQLGYSRVDNVGDDEPPLDGVIHLDGHLAVGVAAGSDFSCARLDDASVRCWGDGTMGQLGTGFVDTVGDDEDPADSVAFTAVPLLGLASDLAAGSQHACARTADASLRCWGNGADGRLGYGDEANVGDTPASLPIKPVPIF